MDQNHQRSVLALIMALSGLLFGPMLWCMQTLPISKVKDKLNELVDAAATTREQVTITKNGSPAAVLIGVDEWESIQESLFWLSQRGSASRSPKLRPMWKKAGSTARSRSGRSSTYPRATGDK
jgi:prevent-host-death family protein